MRIVLVVFSLPKGELYMSVQGILNCVAYLLIFFAVGVLVGAIFSTEIKDTLRLNESNIEAPVVLESPPVDTSVY